MNFSLLFCYNCEVHIILNVILLLSTQVVSNFHSSNLSLPSPIESNGMIKICQTLMIFRCGRCVDSLLYCVNL